jgi:hypothetical protein
MYYETAQPLYEGRGQAENHSDPPPYPEGRPPEAGQEGAGGQQTKAGNTQETSRATKRLRDGETQEDQDLSSKKKHNNPQEPAKAAIPEETGRDGKEKEKREAPQAFTNTIIMIR